MEKQKNRLIKLYVTFLFVLSLFGLKSCRLADLEFPPRFQPSINTEIPAGHLKQFGLQRLPDGPIKEYTEALHPEEFWYKHVSKNEPVVFRQAILQSSAITNWNDEYLKEKYGDLDVLIELKKENRSYSARRMTLETFLNNYKDKDVYVVTVLPDPMRVEIQVPPCLLCGSFVDYIHETNFWMSSGGTRSLVHFDADHILHCLVAGRKHWMVMHQRHVDDFQMEDRDTFSGSGFTKMNPDEVDLFKYPNVSNIHWQYTTLLPGDCIFLPSEYIHQVRSYVRSISATMLFTADSNGTFDARGCDTANITAFTTLDDVRVHWTYNKGDKVIEMGYMNVEVLRVSLLSSMEELKSDFLTEESFKKFWDETVKPVEAQVKSSYVFKELLDIEGKGFVTREDVLKLPQDKFKDLARAMDPPHGPEKQAAFTEPKLESENNNDNESERDRADENEMDGINDEEREDIKEKKVQDVHSEL